MIPWLVRGDPFPPVDQALESPNGLLAATAAVSAEQVIDAYRHGIFPWYSQGEPALWWSPNPRMVLFTAELRQSHSLRKRARSIARGTGVDVLLDRDFVAAMRACAAPRADQAGTWITDDIIAAYAELNRNNLAHSIEVWAGGSCLGGLYGVALGRMFFGESMFSHARDASKIALVALVGLLLKEGVPVIDCQQRTSHLASLGAREIPRSQFCAFVRRAVAAPPIEWSRYVNRSLNDLLLID